MTRNRRVKWWKRSTVVLAVALILICAVVFLNSTDALATSGVVGSWQMEEGIGTLVSDGSDNGNDGTLNDASAWVAGDLNCGSAIHFDGTTGVTVVREPNLEPTNVSLQAMVRGTGWPGPYQYIASKNLGAGWASYALYTGATAGEGLAFYVGGTVTLARALGGSTVWDGNWHHIMGTYDGSNVRIYVDGNQISVTPATFAIGYDTTKNFTIGHYPPLETTAFEHHFEGDIDAVKVWNRALSATEIAQLDPCAPVTPPNTPPSASAGGPYSGDEGSAIGLDASSSSDPDGDTLSFSWSVDAVDCSFDDASVSNPNLTCSDDGSYTATVLVDDGQANASSSTTVAVGNLAPAVGPISAPLEPVIVGSTVNAGASFTNPGALDTHTAVWDWDDEATSIGSVTESDGSGSVGGSHTYADAGVYTVNLTVTDDDGGVGESTFQYIVIYDPAGGFVTGGGWIYSQPDACQLESICSPTDEGMANFGFVSKYKAGASVPIGKTDFNFKTGNLDLESDSYEWLVVTGGGYARFKGSGTIDGAVAPNGETYKFMIWAGDKSSSDGEDSFRIRIWYEDDGSEIVVYDNETDVTLGGGNIKVHDNS